METQLLVYYPDESSCDIKLSLTEEDIEQLREIAGTLTVDCLYKGKITTPKGLLNFLGAIIIEVERGKDNA